jgi:U4/U6 small nuclear ribonucleoprotein PRP3
LQATGKAGAVPEERPAAMPGQAAGIHPLLAQNDVYTARTAKDRYKPMAPKFATLKANVKQNVPTPRPKYNAPSASTSKDGASGAGPSFPPGVNPYYDRSLATEFQPKERSTNKRLKFNQKGKYTRLAEQMRQEQKLEALKARIAEASKKAGLQDEIESGALIKRPAPPDVEWWDSAYLPNRTYDDVPEDIDLDNLDRQNMERVLSKLDLSSVSALIQHPIPIPAPGDKLQQAPKALFLTKKEMKKLRRNRRAAEHKDQQDRIRMGLAPPPPDKGESSLRIRQAMLPSH